MKNLKLIHELSSYFSEYNQKQLKLNPHKFNLWILENSSFSHDIIWKNNQQSIWLQYNPSKNILEIHHKNRKVITSYKDIEEQDIEKIIKIIENELKD